MTNEDQKQQMKKQGKELHVKVEKHLVEEEGKKSKQNTIKFKKQNILNNNNKQLFFYNIIKLPINNA